MNTYQKGRYFEQAVASYLEDSGYVVQFTKISGDFGVDLIAECDGKKIAIQVKKSE